MDTIKHCPQCHKPLSENTLMGFCPDCMIKAGLGTGDATKSAPFVPPTVEELGRHFPKLEILELLGRGGMGAVYKARQIDLDRLVALKILPPSISHDPAFAERFTREAKALAKLHHPHIVTLYEFGQADGLFYFLMEFVDGMNLHQLMKSATMTPEAALVIVPQICDALQFAHDRGIVHRDIKPGNILLNKDDEVKIADFGVAKIIAETGDVSPDDILQSSTTHTGPVGTPQYMAPEQKTHPLEVDHRADIYALGVVFYQMLTGELPAGQLIAPSRKVQLDVRLDEIVLRALEKKPELRYQQVSEVKTMVETILTQPNKNRVSKAKLNRRLIFYSVFVFLLIIAGITWNNLINPKATLKGKVFLPDGTAAVNAMIRVGDLPARSVDSKGNYTVRSIPPGELEVRVEYPGYTPVPPPGNLIELHPGENFYNPSMKEDSTISIRWTYQRQENNLSLHDGDIVTGTAIFNIDNSRFSLGRGASCYGEGSDFMMMKKDGRLVFWLFDAWMSNGLIRSDQFYDEIQTANPSAPYEFLRGMPVRKGDVYLVKCLDGKHYAKMEITDVHLLPGISEWIEETSLKIAAREGNLAKVKDLVASGEDVNAKDNEDSSPLIGAILNEHSDVVQFLIENGADTQIQCIGMNALEWAKKIGNARIIEILNTTRAKPDLTSFQQKKSPSKESLRITFTAAIQHGDINTVKALLDKGVDVNSRGKYNLTALMIAASYSQTEIAKLLLKYGADAKLTISDIDKTTALTYASMSTSPENRGELVKLLIDKGADVNELDGLQTPLMWACGQGQLEDAKLLLENGADWKAHGVVSSAACRETPEFVKLLISHGMDVNYPSEDGRTPLINAAACGRLETVKFLLSKGADVHAKSIAGETALTLATKNGFAEIVKVLKEMRTDKSKIATSSKDDSRDTVSPDRGSKRATL